MRVSWDDTDAQTMYGVDAGPDEFFVYRYRYETVVDPEWGPNPTKKVTESAYLTADGEWLPVPERGLLPPEVRHTTADLGY